MFVIAVSLVLAKRERQIEEAPIEADPLVALIESRTARNSDVNAVVARFIEGQVAFAVLATIKVADKVLAARVAKSIRGNPAPAASVAKIGPLSIFARHGSTRFRLYGSTL